MNQSSISDPKYDGKRISRRQLLEDNVDEDIPSSSEDSGDDVPERSGSEDEDEDDDEDHSEVSDQNDDEGGDEDVPSRVKLRVRPVQLEPSGRRKPAKPPQNDDKPTEFENQDIASALRATREQDRKKGKAVAQQIVSGTVLPSYVAAG